MLCDSRMIGAHLVLRRAGCPRGEDVLARIWPMTHVAAEARLRGRVGHEDHVVLVLPAAVCPFGASTPMIVERATSRIWICWPTGSVRGRDSRATVSPITATLRIARCVALAEERARLSTGQSRIVW